MVKQQIDMFENSSLNFLDNQFWPFEKGRIKKLKIKIEKNGEVKELSFEYARKNYLGHAKSWKIIQAIRMGQEIEFNGWKVKQIDGGRS